MRSVLANPSPQISFSAFRQSVADAGMAWRTRRDQLLTLIDNKPLLLFGFGGKGQMLVHHIQQLTGRKIAVFDSSPSKRGAARKQGFEVVESFNPEDGVNWATILGACQAQFEQKATVKRNFIFYQEAANLFGAPQIENLAGEFESFIPDHLEDLFKVYSILHPFSRQRFLDVLRFRVSSDPTYLRDSRQAVAEMWLDIPERFKTRDYLSFLDVGAFDGDTLRVFNERFGCERGIAVEANSSLFDSIRKVANLYRRGIEIMPKAAWSRSTRLRFDEVRFGMIQVTESPDGELEAATIDSYAREQVDILKMDIEGAESPALMGCKLLLNKFKPDLAIAAYHRPEDFVKLFKQIQSLGVSEDCYDWHFGHYSDCLDDSIFYCLKR
jgi:FkbM family methyltransferase